MNKPTKQFLLLLSASIIVFVFSYIYTNGVTPYDYILSGVVVKKEKNKYNTLRIMENGKITSAFMNLYTEPKDILFDIISLGDSIYKPVGTQGIIYKGDKCICFDLEKHDTIPCKQVKFSLLPQ